MPPTKSPILTEAELRLMDVLWERGPCSVQQVLVALPGTPRLAYNSVLTTMRVLEKKGYVEHVKDGRAHIYAPAIRREDATKSEISHLLSRFFKNSRELLLLNILEDGSIDQKELTRLRSLIAKSSATGGGE
jgi:BlaI family transcriptional regulator, penicillinase repressor